MLSPTNKNRLLTKSLASTFFLTLNLSKNIETLNMHNKQSKDTTACMVMSLLPSSKQEKEIHLWRHHLVFLLEAYKILQYTSPGGLTSASQIMKENGYLTTKQAHSLVKALKTKWPLPPNL